MDTLIKRSSHTLCKAFVWHSPPLNVRSEEIRSFKVDVINLGEVITGLSATVTLSPSMHSGGKHSRRPSAGSSSTGTSHIRVPYLDPKLTYLLKDSFGGLWDSLPEPLLNDWKSFFSLLKSLWIGLSKTAMLFHVSPLVQDYQVT